MRTFEKFGAPIVRNMLGRTGKPVANQVVILMPAGTMFKSYNSRVCWYDHNSNELFFGTNWNHSRTTSKYLAQFLRVYAPEWYARIMAYGKRSFSANVQQAICDGVVTFVENW